MRAVDSVQVRIFGQIYHVRSGDDPERVRRVAETVDRVMNRIADQGRSMDNFRIAVLAALELTDELLEVREELEQFRSQVSRRSDRIEEFLARVERAPASEALHPAAD